MNFDIDKLTRVAAKAVEAEIMKADAVYQGPALRVRYEVQVRVATVRAVPMPDDDFPEPGGSP
jgi:hypothetical protein